MSRYDDITRRAFDVLPNAYVPYSGFRVGACIALRDGSYVTGVNVENASYGLTNCAERSAVFAAYSQGYRREDIVAMAVVTEAKSLTTPCGACRQVLSELLLADTPIVLANKREERVTNIRELLPDCFGEDSLSQGR